MEWNGMGRDGMGWGVGKEPNRLVVERVCRSDDAEKLPTKQIQLSRHIYASSKRSRKTRSPNQSLTMAGAPLRLSGRC